MAAMCEPDAATKNPDAQRTFANIMMQQAATLHLLPRGPKQKSTFIFLLVVAYHSYTNALSNLEVQPEVAAPCVTGTLVFGGLPRRRNEYAFRKSMKKSLRDGHQQYTHISYIYIVCEGVLCGRGLLALFAYVVYACAYFSLVIGCDNCKSKLLL